MNKNTRVEEEPLEHQVPSEPAASKATAIADRTFASDEQRHDH